MTTDTALHATAILLDSSDGPVPCVALDNGDAHAKVALQGGQLLSWRPACGGERLYRSTATRFGAGRSIRAGIPVVFPQFADRGPLPRHGFARAMDWSFAGVNDVEGRAAAVFVLGDDDQTRALWPHRFALELHVVPAGDALELALIVRNPGNQPLTFACALHSYLRVDDLASTTLEGLEGARTLERGTASVSAPPSDIRFGPEIDRIYPGHATPKRLSDGRQQLLIETTGFTDTVVWNPGAALAAGMADIAPGDHERFVCVEPACIESCVELPAGDTWQGTLRMTAFASGR